MNVDYEYPFAQIPLWVVQTGSFRAVIVYCGLASFISKDRTCYPSRSKVAEFLGVSEDTVKRGIHELNEIGALDITPQFDDDGRQTSNYYLLRMSPRGCQIAPHEGCQTAPQEGCSDAPQTISIKNYIHKNHNSSSPGAKDADHPEFADFWKSYPRKQSRGQAVKSHKQAIRKVSASVILEAVRLQAKTEGYRLARAPKYIPLASTWLNGDGWLDEPEASEAKPSNDLFSKYGV